MADQEADQRPAVLVVDDEPLVLHLMERTLKAAGYQVVTATDAVSALRAAADQPVPPTVLVTDLRMEPVNGADLAKLVTTQWPGTRVLFVSGYDPDHTEMSTSFLRKPFRNVELVQAVAQLLGSSTPAVSNRHRGPAA